MGRAGCCRRARWRAGSPRACFAWRATTRCSGGARRWGAGSASCWRWGCGRAGRCSDVSCCTCRTRASARTSCRSSGTTCCSSRHSSRCSSRRAAAASRARAAAPPARRLPHAVAAGPPVRRVRRSRSCSSATPRGATSPRWRRTGRPRRCRPGSDGTCTSCRSWAQQGEQRIHLRGGAGTAARRLGAAPVCGRSCSVRRWSPFQVVVIATANYGFFNYLSLALCLWVLDDGHLPWGRDRRRRRPAAAATTALVLATVLVVALYDRAVPAASCPGCARSPARYGRCERHWTRSARSTPTTCSRR